MFRSLRRTSLALGAAAALALVGAPTQAATSREKAPPEFVALRDVDPTVMQEIRYAGFHNFTGQPVPGYDQPECLLTRTAANAVHAAQQRLLREGYSLKVYDCYRPQRAVDHFFQWSQNPADQRMKAEFYPAVDKSQLFADGYIDRKSGHSRGSTVDLTMVKLPAAPQPPYVPGEPLKPCTAPKGQRFPDNSVEAGTGFDCFDTLAHTDDPRVTGPARDNRQKLKSAMESAGMQNYPNEWWHFTAANEPFPNTYFNFPVSRASLTSP